MKPAEVALVVDRKSFQEIRLLHGRGGKLPTSKRRPVSRCLLVMAGSVSALAASSQATSTDTAVLSAPRN